MKLLAGLSMIATAAGGASVIDSHSLVPLGILVAGVLLAGSIAWKLATFYGRLQRRLHDQARILKQLCEKHGIPFLQEDDDEPI